MSCTSRDCDNEDGGDGGSVDADVVTVDVGGCGGDEGGDDRGEDDCDGDVGGDNGGDDSGEVDVTTDNLLSGHCSNIELSVH